MATVEPFWNKVIDAADTVLRHPQTELEVEYGDQLATVWAKRDPINNELMVEINIRRVNKQHAES